MFKKNEIKKIEKMLLNKYLIGIDYTKNYLELRVYDPSTNTIDYDFFDISDDEIVDKLHKRRRKDSIKMYKENYNDIYINQVNDENKAMLSFDKVDNKYQIHYDVSINLIRRLDEIDFIRSFIDLYSENRKVYSIDKNIIDLKYYRDNKTIMPLGCNIELLDNQNYVKELHILGKLLCAEFIPGFEEMKELQDKERKM